MVAPRKSLSAGFPQSPMGGASASLDGAIGVLKLTPQERNIWQHHQYNLHNIGTGGVANKDGTISTVYQMVVTGPGGKFYSIPSVWNGRILNEREAVQMAAKQGWDKWPSYDTPEEADKRYQMMHPFMEGPAPSKPPPSRGAR